ncbi:MAG: uroporphyrinogen-III C-methyltransferase [Pseudomonadota bacterium]|nr:uroporphyrinogen-III C-methyltransferase [Pseudomonadota bacterium]
MSSEPMALPPQPPQASAQAAPALPGPPLAEPPAGISPPASAPAPALAASLRRARGWQPGLVVAWLAAAVALTVSVLLWQKVTGMQQQLARQSAEAGSQSVEARTLARRADETARANATQLAALQTRVDDMTAYRAQLEGMVQSLARARDENLAVELETALRIAQDQAQLTGSVEPLLAALRTAEQRLARSLDPRLAPVMRAVGRDLERVKTATIADTAGLLARIDQLLRQIDDLPAANAAGSGHTSQPVRETGAQPPQSWWGRQWQTLLDEAVGLVRVSRVERPEASMLSPEQVFFLRENLKLRLQGARLAILARQYEAARADLAAAATLIGTWFDPASRRTQAAATLLQNIQGQTKSAHLPRVSETLQALANAMAASGTRDSAPGGG